MAAKCKGATALTGGTAGCLDAINGALLSDGDPAIVITSDLKVYFYRLNASSGAAESSPNVIAPDTNAGDKRWILIGMYVGDLTVVGTLLMSDQIIQRANFKDCGIVTNAIGSIGGGTQDIDLTLGNSVSATVDTAETTFTFSNPTASDELCVFTLILTNGGSQTVNWPASVDWRGGTAPSLTASGVDILVFATVDGGTTWHGADFSMDSK